ncbi:Inactive serine protease 39 [Apodemus speciosus]|uniref:Inactive serine protease 39 n=1 Tax=Apodemus speciosus TaxID=105296 RepID=A0ABQ0ECP5_APOSI
MENCGRRPQHVWNICRVCRKASDPQLASKEKVYFICLEGSSLMTRRHAKRHAWEDFTAAVSRLGGRNGKLGGLERRSSISWGKKMGLLDGRGRGLSLLHAQDYTPSQTPPPTSNTPPKPTGRIHKELCGKTKFQGKIYGGQIARAERWPWQASLIFRGRHICGAVLTDKNWVASAAHCFQRSLKPSDYRILLGYNELSNPSNYSRQMTVNKIFMPEDYTQNNTLQKNIALIQLHHPVIYSSHIFPACVPDNTTKVSLESLCWISGWGMLSEERCKFLQEPFPLLDAEVYLIDEQECEIFFHTPEVSIFEYEVIKDDMICAADITNEKSFCRRRLGGSPCLLSGWLLVRGRAGQLEWSMSQTDSRPQHLHQGLLLF